MSLRQVAVAALTLAFLAAPLPSHGQEPAKVYRMGFLGAAGPDPTNTTPQHCPRQGQGSLNWQAFVEGLRERGYVPGHNLVIECRYTEGRDERAPALAAELVNLKVDLIFASGSPRALGAKQATRTIPIVMAYVVDPVALGLVASLAHPGGNVTGLTFLAGVEVVGKHLQLLKEAVPRLSRVAVLSNPGDPFVAWERREMQAAAQALGVTLHFYEVREATEFASAFAAMTKAREDALLVPPQALANFHARRIANLAAQSRLPAMYPFRESVEAGGLMAYAASVRAMFHRAGYYVDKILTGTKPADLPVERPTKFDLLISLKTAKALGLTLPQSLLLRADEVIQ